MCPATSHYGRVPATFLVLGYNDQQVAHGNKHVKDLDQSFLVERVSASEVRCAAPR